MNWDPPLLPPLLPASSLLPIPGLLEASWTEVVSKLLVYHDAPSCHFQGNISSLAWHNRQCLREQACMSPAPITNVHYTATIILYWEIFVMKFFHVLRFNFCCWEYWQKLSTLKHIDPPAASQKPVLTGILANFRWQSRFELVKTTLTSSHALSFLLHLLITSVIAFAGMAELIWKITNGDAAGPFFTVKIDGVR